MYSDFKRAFKDEPSYKTKIPQAVLDAISVDLPDGFKYVNAENGVCRIDTNEEFIIGIDNIVFPDSTKKVSFQIKNMSDIWTYSYNAQKRIELRPDKNGNFKLNGVLIKAEDFIKTPFENIENIKSEFFLVPHPFPEPFIITVGSEDKRYEMRIPVRRKAFESLDAKKFESVDDSPIKLTWIVDDIKENVTFNIKTVVEKAKTIRAIVDSNHIFNSFLEGKGKIAGLILPINKEKRYSAISDEVVEFWDRVLELEEYFKVAFIPGEEITTDLVNRVDELYQCFIKREPFKKYQNFTEFSGGGYSEVKNMEETIGKELYFEMVITERDTLLNVELNLSGLMGIYGSMVKSIERKSDGDYKIQVEPMKGKKMYSSIMYFKDEASVEEYRKKSEHIDELKDAVELAYL